VYSDIGIYDVLVLSVDSSLLVCGAGKVAPTRWQGSTCACRSAPGNVTVAHRASRAGKKCNAQKACPMLGTALAQSRARCRTPWTDVQPHWISRSRVSQQTEQRNEGSADELNLTAPLGSAARAKVFRAAR